jgi:hypothetical protein
MRDVRRIGATVYSLGSVIPGNLKRVALVTGTPPPSVQRVKVDIYNSPDEIPADVLKVAAIPYAHGAAIPRGLLQVADPTCSVG